MTGRLLTALMAASLPVLAADPPPPQPPQPLLPVAQAPGPSPERQALEKLSVENLTQKELLNQRLRKLTEEREEAAQQYLLHQEKLKNELADLEAQQRRAALQNAAREERIRQELSELEIKQRRLGLESALDPRRRQLEDFGLEGQLEREKLALKLRPTHAAREELSATLNLDQEKLRSEVAAVEAQTRRLSVQNQLADEKHRQDLMEMRQKRERLRLEAELEREKLGLEIARFDREKSEIDLESRRLDLKSRRLRFETEEKEHKSIALRTDIDLRDRKEDWKSQANRDPEYLKEPFQKGVLTVSDRRIPLNGPIVKGVADFVGERIHYFNNKGDEPIFIMIDRSPGGSVMEGYRIVKAMRASKAPVYVVVRSFAASMAAVITALAPKSYAYPNAVILHHQMSSFMFGNMTQMREQLAIANEWYRRLGNPVAEKMGTSLDSFTKQMYSHNSDGDWEEFADDAKKLKWVDDVVHEIRETGYIKDPDRNATTAKPALFEWKEEMDVKGERFVRLPRLEPYDLYYLYNRDGYYR
ncbi:MAG: ATP-dependent Clp protease proteolytic subunit [Elusimicrobia bacterium]|nr:ATP-dependent Clp protease proteolytic subunit [Elusimicrobiota bacterium]